MNTILAEQETKRREPSAFTKGLCDGTNRTDNYRESAAVAVKETNPLLKKCKDVIVKKSIQPIKQEEPEVDSTQIVREIEEELGR